MVRTPTIIPCSDPIAGLRHSARYLMSNVFYGWSGLEEPLGISPADTVLAAIVEAGQPPVFACFRVGSCVSGSRPPVRRGDVATE